MKTIAQKIVIPALKGKKTIARADDIFTGWIDSDFEKLDLDKKGSPTNEMKVEVKEITGNMKFAEIFTDPDKMCLSQEQIIEFCKNYKDELSKNYYTFFLFKVSDEFFVAGVGVGSVGLGVIVCQFSRDYVLYARLRRRFVIPQLTTETLDYDTLTPSPLTT